MPDTADRVAMRQAEAVWEELYRHGHLECREHDVSALADIAATLSSHGLRELIDATEKPLHYPRHDRTDCPGCRIEKARTALLGEGETLKAEEQADG